MCWKIGKRRKNCPQFGSVRFTLKTDLGEMGESFLADKLRKKVYSASGF